MKQLLLTILLGLFSFASFSQKPAVKDSVVVSSDTSATIKKPIRDSVDSVAPDRVFAISDSTAFLSIKDLAPFIVPVNNYLNDELVGKEYKQLVKVWNRILIDAAERYRRKNKLNK